MHYHIQNVLMQIEKDYDLKILYACEAGSRTWGIASNDSDYDVRFIYIHKQEWYLSIDQERDVIEIPKHDHFSIPLDPQLDLSGWDITKALKLFRKSNPPLLEWLGSPIIYYEENNFLSKIKSMAPDVFSPISCIYHYLNMAKKNYKQFLTCEKVKVKKYFYVLRPILAARWIAKYNCIPPVLLQDLVDDILCESSMQAEIHNLIQRKIAGDTEESRNENLLRYIEDEYITLEVYAKTLINKMNDPTSKLNEFFRDTLYEVWG
ncbi:nucleotidyltransferase domain-containing protein [Bacillus sp. S/N-304-OC-R1]|uniref:nucleotidyltransferase domain-containing protein n=1 Tax=Bacillus sp. S/N-304-OC-R1 TaxID=2758034 RepID=UPI001C8EEF7F|nr:nucleotidyltransferase domain-containing protein [Bacillus sp. S/N-304-OC-R1]MBY0121310.1 nucleotidyltransferase domain-containing protein [Bacillus sp. S/N-304-OC-R1]